MGTIVLQFAFYAKILLVVECDGYDVPVTIFIGGIGGEHTVLTESLLGITQIFGHSAHRSISQIGAVVVLADAGIIVNNLMNTRTLTHEVILIAYRHDTYD